MVDRTIDIIKLIRMMNQDVIELYRRVPNGAKVMVLPANKQSESPEAS